MDSIGDNGHSICGLTVDWIQKWKRAGMNGSPYGRSGLGENIFSLRCRTKLSYETRAVGS